MFLYNKGSILQQYYQYWIYAFGTQLLMTRLAMLSAFWVSALWGAQGQNESCITESK